MTKILTISQGTLQIFVGLSAAISGMMLIVFPSGALLHAPLEMLNGSPFSDFLIPGIILFLMNGVGQLLAGIMTFRRNPSAPLTGAVLGLGLIIWIFIQVNMIGGGHILQYSYFFIGITETALAFLIGGFGSNSKQI